MMGFHKYHGYHILFVKSLKNEFMMVLVYVNDIIIASTSLDEAMRLTGDLKKCLNWEILVRWSIFWGWRFLVVLMVFLYVNVNRH